MTPLIYLSFFGVAVLRPRLGAAGLYPVDVPLAALVVWSCHDMARRGSAGEQLLRRLAPWVWVIFLASLLAIVDDGLAGWALVSMLKTLFALLFFTGTLHAFERFDVRIAAMRATYAGIAVTLFGLLFVHDHFDRPRAFFMHPNYAAHYLAVAGSIVFFYGEKSRWRIVGSGAAIFGVYLTGSFGAVVMLAAGGVAYFLITRPRGWVLVLIGIVIPTAVYIARNFAQDSAEVSEGLSAERFETSRDGREVIWSNMIAAWESDPLGYGPDGTAKKFISGDLGLESHNDWLAHLCERGPVGLIGLVGFWAALWRFAPPRSASRVLMVSAMAAGVLRETLTYRHLWLLLAVAISVDRAAVARGRETSLLRPW